MNLPKHTVEVSSLEPKTGMRVQINVNRKIDDEECKSLINAYRIKGRPDGQVSVHMPSKLLKDALAPFCVENFDVGGVRFQRYAFEE